MSFGERVEICGGIASGKTTLAQALGSPDETVILEDFRANPFWRAFYENPGQFIFETELAFVLQHYHMLKANATAAPIVADFSFALDLAYAKIGLEGRRLELFKAIVDEIHAEIGLPRLLVALRCPDEVEAERTRQRGRREEGGITADWLAQLNAAVYSVADDYGSSGVSVLWIDSHANDFRESGSARPTVVEKVRSALSIPG